MNLRDYQIAALTSWFDSDFRSIFAMATGTGKTRTAMACLDKLHNKLRSERTILTVVLVCPLIHLVDQWAEYFARSAWSVVRAFQSRASWEQELMAGAERAARLPGSKFAVIVTQATFSTPHFQRILESLPGEMALVGDEVHNLGSQSVLPKLPRRAKYRLGLSATPSRWGDPQGTEALTSYFGEVSYSFSISDAIQSGALCPYLYFPRVANLTFEETAGYIEITSSIGKILRGREFVELSDSEQERVGKLLRARAAIIGMASEKLPLLMEDLGGNVGKMGQLVYCPEGSDNGQRFIDTIQLEMYTRGYQSSAIYDSQTSHSERQAILASFSSGHTKHVLSMRCLDEGVDVPNAQIAYFMASSANPRQFIQRRGRVLRQNGGNKIAMIYDYFVLPNLQAAQQAIEVEQAIGRRELSRVRDFIDSCSNPAEALDLISPLRRFYE